MVAIIPVPGICAVYRTCRRLSRGKAEGRRVLPLLFRRLGIPWREDPAFCREAGAWLEECYDRLFSEENMGRVWRFCGNRRRHIAATRFS